ncbi:MAG: AmmeMemoRadiSam system radical SAM enzyme [Bacteroidia bacterium]|nr:AmmeMemoRadiSam system radical SAM enzyme [Bacteroidia bacterium]
MEKMNKRRFIEMGLAGIGGFCLSRNSMAMDGIMSSKTGGLWKWSKEAFYYSETPRGLKCLVCPNECTLKPGETSLCRNRVSKDNKLYSVAYGNPCAVYNDPIEKKPLLHFLPNTHAYSIATAGCNFACLNCQNWEISQSSPYDTNNEDLMPGKVVENCLAQKCRSVAYTYSEPISFYEYMFDTAKLAREKNLKNVLVSNGYINEKPLRDLCRYIDAANINLKSFSDDIYLRLNAGKLQPVLDTLKTLRDEGVWLEITNLVVPSWTDDFDMIKRMCDWLVLNKFDNYPLHFLKFHPMYKLTQLPSTPDSALHKAKEIALNAGCKYIYMGNVADLDAMSVYCPKCKTVVLQRKGYMVVSKNLKLGACAKCGCKINGVWE